MGFQPVARALPLFLVSLLVQKFGGTSVADPDRMRSVADYVARCRRRGDQVTMVVSAMGKETDELLHVASRCRSTQPGREMDMLITAGERKAIALMCMALGELGVPAHSFTGSQAGFLTDTNHQNAKILEINPYRVRKRRSTTASCRSWPAPRACPPTRTSPSSDAADPTPRRLRWPRPRRRSCELFTDVSGVSSAPIPAVCPQATKMSSISFDELLEMTADRLPQTGDALGRGRPQPQRSPSHPIRLHLGAGHLVLDEAGHTRHWRIRWSSRSSGPSPTICPSRRSPSPTYPTSPASPPPCSGRWPRPGSTST